MATITSLHNERVKLTHALQTSGKARRKEHRVVLEGVRLIADATTAEVRPDFVLYTQETLESASDQTLARLLVGLRDSGVECIDTTPEIMQHLSDTQTPQGVLAVVFMPAPADVIPADVTFALILDGVADPGNLGTILRTAAAAGVDLVILAPHCVDPYNPKVLRSGMGAHFRVPMDRKTWPEIAAEYGHLALYVAESEHTTPYYAVDWTEPAALVIGGEAHGTDDQARLLPHTGISIPMFNAVESLNAAMATAVILFEGRRQRAAR